jgi:peptide/nickel transport system permease protein
MLWYALRRLILAVPLLIGITFVSFLVIHLAPGDPLEMTTGGEMPTEASVQAQQALRELYGLDKPLHVQYWRWLTRLARLDFGKSFAPDGRPVLEKIRERLPVTLSLNIIELAIILLVAIPIGVASATRQYSTFDKVTTVFVFVGFATPDFWLALLLMMLFGVQLGWPISGLRSLNWEYLSFWKQQWDFLSHLVLPIAVATFGGLAGFSRYMRQSMLEVIRQDYVQSARAKGLAERVVIGKHALRNALLPIVTILGLSLPGLIGGSVIVEWTFAIPGMGQLMVQSVFQRDYPVIMGNLVIVAALTLVANLVADLCYGLVDPRIRLAGRRGRR